MREGLRHFCRFRNIALPTIGYPRILLGNKCTVLGRERENRYT